MAANTFERLQEMAKYFRAHSKNASYIIFKIFKGILENTQ